MKRINRPVMDETFDERVAAQKNPQIPNQESEGQRKRDFCDFRQPFARPVRRK